MQLRQEAAGAVELSVVVPPGTSGSVCVPVKGAVDVQLNGRAAATRAELGYACLMLCLIGERRAVGAPSRRRFVGLDRAPVCLIMLE